MPRNGAALAGLRAAADLLRREMDAAGLTLQGACERTGLNPPVLFRFLDRHTATRHTLERIERSFRMQLPRPQASIFSLTTMRARWCGFEYEITGPAGPIKCWHRGTESEVREYAERVVKRAHYASTVIA